MLCRTVSVTLLRPVQTGEDSLGNPTYGEPAREVVSGVMVQSPMTSDQEAARPYGVTVSYVLQWPAAHAASLRGCGVALPEGLGGPYRVVGDPMPDPNAPLRFANRWNRAVMVARADG